MKKAYFLIILLALFGGVFFARQIINGPDTESSKLNIHGSSVSPSPTNTQLVSVTKTPTSSPNQSGRKVIDVPFTSQAPYGVWDELHGEMCEEATLVMAHAWVEGIQLTPAYAETELQRLAKWGTDNLGTYVDTSARQTAEMGKAVYGLKTKIIDRPSVTDIKREIDNGNIVIMGMAGRLLGNPYYTPPGPIYHMILIKGYDATGFITNDDGTRRGESFHYSYNTIMNAAHDFSGSRENLTSSPAVALVVSK